MRLTDFVEMSWSNFRRQRHRVLPGIIGVALGAAILLDVLAIGSWIQGSTARGILAQGSLTRIKVTPVPVTASTRQVPSITIADAAWMRSLAHVRDGYPDVEVSVAGMAGTQGLLLHMQNLPSSSDRPRLISGRWPEQNEAVLPDSGLQSKDGRAVGGASFVGIPISLEIPISNGLAPPKHLRVNIVGTYRVSAQQGPEPATLVSLQTVEQILLTERIGTPTGGLSEYPAYFLDADAPNHTAAVAAEVKKRGFSPDYLEAQLQGLSERILGIQALVGILVLLILVFAGLSIVNTLSQAVRQRRRELGVLAALGFGRLWIGSLVAMEAVITSAIGGVLGVALAFAITEAFRFVVPTLQVSIPLLDVAVVLAGVFPFAAAAALAPVLLVNRLDPVEVLRNE